MNYRTRVRLLVRSCPVDTTGLNRTDIHPPLGVVSGCPVSGPSGRFTIRTDCGLASEEKCR
jgi:hypothetical protein